MTRLHIIHDALRVRNASARPQLTVIEGGRAPRPALTARWVLAADGHLVQRWALKGAR